MAKPETLCELLTDDEILLRVQQELSTPLRKTYGEVTIEDLTNLTWTDVQALFGKRMASKIKMAVWGAGLRFSTGRAKLTAAQKLITDTWGRVFKAESNGKTYAWDFAMLARGPAWGSKDYQAAGVIEATVVSWRRDDLENEDPDVTGWDQDEHERKAILDRLERAMRGYMRTGTRGFAPTLEWFSRRMVPYLDGAELSPDDEAPEPHDPAAVGREEKFVIDLMREREERAQRGFRR